MGSLVKNGDFPEFVAGEDTGSVVSGDCGGETGGAIPVVKHTSDARCVERSVSEVSSRKRDSFSEFTPSLDGEPTLELAGAEVDDILGFSDQTSSDDLSQECGDDCCLAEASSGSATGSTDPPVDADSEPSPFSDRLYHFGLSVDQLSAKKAEIEAALDSKPVDKQRLCELACSRGGLVCDKLRRRVWPVLLDLDDSAACDQELSDKQLRSHWQYNQVVLDVQRTLQRFPAGVSVAVRRSQLTHLVRLLLNILTAMPQLHYYQGLHDVAITVLLACGRRRAAASRIMHALCADDRFLAAFMAESMAPTCDQLAYMSAVLERRRPQLAAFLARSGVGVAFAVPWLLTWFSHSLRHYRRIVRVFDYVLASERLSVVYVSAALVLCNAERVLACDCDMASVHVQLSSLVELATCDDVSNGGGDGAVSTCADWQTVLDTASGLMRHLPPQRLHARVNEINAQRRRDEQQVHMARRRRDGGASMRWTAAAVAVLAGSMALQWWFSSRATTGA